MASWQLDLVIVPKLAIDLDDVPRPAQMLKSSEGFSTNVWLGCPKAWRVLGLTVSNLRQAVSDILPEKKSKHGEIYFGDKFSVLLEFRTSELMVSDMLLRASLLPSFPPPDSQVTSHMASILSKTYESVKYLNSSLDLVALWPDDFQPCVLDNAYLFEERARQTKAWKFAALYAKPEDSSDE